jgi:membrane protease YdiL (CAAX protease family)
MILFVKREIRTVFDLFRENRTETVIITTATLVMVLEHYYVIGNAWFSNLLFFVVIPLFVTTIALRRNPLDYGVRIGKPKVWGFHVVLFCLIAWLTLFLVSTNPDLREYYKKDDFSLISYFLVTFVNLVSSEFLFRGFLLFGLKEKFGTGSILLQMIPFVLVHLGKPDLETLSTIVTGIWFGYICYRGESFWPAFIVHMFINVFFLAVVNL